MIRDSDLVVRGEVLEKIQYLVERARRDKANQKAPYSEGYEDGLFDLADALHGWCNDAFVIEAAGPAARQSLADWRIGETPLEQTCDALIAACIDLREAFAAYHQAHTKEPA